MARVLTEEQAKKLKIFPLADLSTRWHLIRAMQVKPLLYTARRPTSPSRLSEVLKRLESSCWYWGAMDSAEAMNKLKCQPVGTYLLRDSSDARHLFTLSVRTAKGMTNVRILYKKGRFNLDSVDPTDRCMPNFDCVLKLIYYYARVSNNLDGRKVFAMQNQETDGETATDTPQREVQFVLKKPLFSKPATLKHLCRRAVNRTFNLEELMALNLPQPIEDYMLKYPYPI
ncbi:suppressor of cytokine signaling 2-like isoform X2 [Dendronephthya gigantea]|uniref:suppressor of cytokine signaling 2-like isoform X2 n=1 Tax=Dendronephthya gigantea TaxID=151771 RepID=UPI00106B263A|nr:suppressor of cytokine signaling 2-like isoform X2 [Dendronephthya gigantea]